MIPVSIYLHTRIAPYKLSISHPDTKEAIEPRLKAKPTFLHTIPFVRITWPLLNTSPCSTVPFCLQAEYYFDAPSNHSTKKSICTSPQSNLEEIHLREKLPALTKEYGSFVVQTTPVTSGRKRLSGCYLSGELSHRGR